jgi:hypothetical protein
LQPLQCQLGDGDVPHRHSHNSKSAGAVDDALYFASRVDVAISRVDGI